MSLTLNAIHKPVTDISKNDENFLKEFSTDFYRKIIDTKDFNTLEDTLITQWINNNNKSTKTILELAQNHEHAKFWFSSIIGFFYQYGLSCAVDKNKALESYLLAIRNDDEKEFTNQNFTNLHSLENEFYMLKNINIIIGKFLLSLFYYKDIILIERGLSKCLKSAIKGDSIAQCNLGNCFYHGREITRNYDNASEWYSKSANNECAEGQFGLANCYYHGR